MAAGFLSGSRFPGRARGDAHRLVPNGICGWGDAGRPPDGASSAIGPGLSPACRGDAIYGAMGDRDIGFHFRPAGKRPLGFQPFDLAQRREGWRPGVRRSSGCMRGRLRGAPDRPVGGRRSRLHRGDPRVPEEWRERQGEDRKGWASRGGRRDLRLGGGPPPEAPENGGGSAG